MNYWIEKDRADRLAKMVAELKQAIRDADAAVHENEGVGLDYFIDTRPTIQSRARSRDVIRAALQENTDE